MQLYTVKVFHRISSHRCPFASLPERPPGANYFWEARLTRHGVNRQKLARCISILATPKMGCDGVDAALRCWIWVAGVSVSFHPPTYNTNTSKVHTSAQGSVLCLDARKSLSFLLSQLTYWARVTGWIFNSSTASNSAFPPPKLVFLSFLSYFLLENWGWLVVAAPSAVYIYFSFCSRTYIFRM